MKSLPAVSLAVAFAACGLAQQRGSRSADFVRPQAVIPHNSIAPRGIAFPAPGDPALRPNPLSITNPGFATSLGATVAGRGDGRAFRRGRQPVLVPYAYPVYVGDLGGYGYGGYGNGYGYAPPDQPPVQQGPQVVINQNFVPEHANPVMHDYTDDSSGGVRVYEAPGRQPVETSEEDTTNYYLIAFKDHSIYSAFAYWVEGDTLHYVTPQRVHNQVSLSLVDRDLTDHLNRDRQLQVKLPNK